MSDLSHTISIDWSRLGHSALIALAAIATFKIATRSLRRVAQKLERRGGDPAAVRRSVTLVTLSVNALRYIIAALAALMILDKMKVDTRPLLASAGILGLACAMGAQNLVKDLVSGFFILFEGQLAVGDLIDLGGQTGIVEEIGLRVTRLRDAAGTVRYWPNGAITTVINYSQGNFDYALTVWLERDHETEQQSAVAAAVAAFQMEFDAFAKTTFDPTVSDLPGGARLLRMPLPVKPYRLALVQQKLPARITAALTELNAAPVAGREPSLTWVPRETDE